MTEADVLQALQAGPQSITELAGVRYVKRKPVRAAIDALLVAGKVRSVAFGKVRRFALSEWHVTDEWLVEYIGHRIEREGAHQLWTGNWDRWRRAVLFVDGQRYDVRRTLYRIRTGKTLDRRKTVRSTCEHETCMAPQCQAVSKIKGSNGRRMNVATKAKLAAAKRAHSPYGPELVALVKASDKSYSQIARETGMKLSTVGAIKSGRLWRDYSSPWAGLMAV